jgi:hypothetical protein
MELAYAVPRNPRDSIDLNLNQVNLEKQENFLGSRLFCVRKIDEGVFFVGRQLERFVDVLHMQ